MSADEATVRRHAAPLTATGGTTSMSPRRGGCQRPMPACGGGGGGGGGGEDKALAPNAVPAEKQKRSDDSPSPSSPSSKKEAVGPFPPPKMASHALSTSNLNSAMTNSKVRNRGKQVEDVVRGLAMEEWNARWLEELVAKIKQQLTDSPPEQDHDGSSLSDEDSPTPLSESSSSSSPASSPTRQFQCTVEDDVASQDGPRDKAPGSSALFPMAPQPSLSRASSHLSSTASSDLSFSVSNISTASTYNEPAQKITSHLPSPPESAARGVNFPPSPPRPSVRFSDKRPIIHHNHTADSSPQHAPRPTVLERASTEPGLSPVDLKWGRLFNDRDEPTPALGRFLRGIANYIIAQYSPTDSLVITPDKLYKFYSKFKLDTEAFPSQRIFDTRFQRTLRGLEFIYADLRCEHHLVQDCLTSRPHTPALTPAGFEDWMTLLIRAFPGREAKRLDLVVAELPIEADGRNADGSKPERLPKQLSRHLFPARGHAKAHDLLVSSLTEWNKITAPAEPASPAWTSSSPPTHSTLSAQKGSASSKSTREDAARRCKDEHMEHIEQISNGRSSRSRSRYLSSSSIPSPSTLSAKAYELRGSNSSSGSKNIHSERERERERESRLHRGSSERTSRRSRDLSPPPAGRYHHRNKRYRGGSPGTEER